MIKHLKSWQNEETALTDNNIISPFYGYIKSNQNSVYMKSDYDPGTELKTKIFREKYVLEKIDYITFVATVASGISLSNFGGNLPNVEYSKNGGSWTTWDYNNIPMSPGDSIRMKGLNSNGFCYNSSKYSQFVMFGSIEASGNIMSLIDGAGNILEIPHVPSCFCRLFKGCTALKTCPKLPATTLYGGCYFSLFQGTGITDASTLDLPANEITTYPLWGEDPYDYCGAYSQLFAECINLVNSPVLKATQLNTMSYYGMFYNCTNLTSVPELPATTLAPYCYADMFHGCSNLNNIPELNATTLALGCYEYMFNSCSSLTIAPDLQASILVEKCYEYMFTGCTSLASIKCLATDITASNCTNNWVSGISGEGQFVCPNSMQSTWNSKSSGSGKPTNFTYVDA